MRECDCAVPEDAGKIRPGYCRFCGGRIPQDVLSTDKTFSEFFDQLAALPGVDPAFIEHCRRREFNGRDEFGNAFLDRENCLEGLEEACDLGIYSRLHLLRMRREHKREHVELALEAARLAALAYAALARLHHAS